MKKKLVLCAVIFPVILIFGIITLKASVGKIEGEKVVCLDSGITYKYKYCRSQNFPYHWGWNVPPEATMINSWASGNCYYVNIIFGKRSGNLKWWGKNPSGLPTVNPVSTYITVKKCEEEKVK